MISSFIEEHVDHVSFAIYGFLTDPHPSSYSIYGILSLVIYSDYCFYYSISI